MDNAHIHFPMHQNSNTDQHFLCIQTHDQHCVGLACPHTDSATKGHSGNQ